MCIVMKDICIKVEFQPAMHLFIHVTLNRFIFLHHQIESKTCVVYLLYIFVPFLFIQIIILLFFSMQIKLSLQATLTQRLGFSVILLLSKFFHVQNMPTTSIIHLTILFHHAVKIMTCNLKTHRARVRAVRQSDVLSRRVAVQGLPGGRTLHD